MSRLSSLASMPYASALLWLFPLVSSEVRLARGLYKLWQSGKLRNVVFEPPLRLARTSAPTGQGSSLTGPDNDGDMLTSGHEVDWT